MWSFKSEALTVKELMIKVLVLELGAPNDSLSRSVVSCIRRSRILRHTFDAADEGPEFLGFS